MILPLLFLALLLPSSLTRHEHLPEYDILVIVPDDDEKAEAGAVNGDEILRSALLAEQRLHQEKLPFTLNVKTLRTDCRLYSPVTLVRLAGDLTAVHGDRLTVAVVGFYCKKTLQELELIGVGSRDRLGLVQISVNTFLPETVGSSRPYYYQMFPSSLAYAEALSHFMNHVGWTRHGIAFTEHQNSFYFEDSQKVIRALKDRGFGPTMKLFKVTDNIRTRREANIIRAVKSIHASGVKVLYVILPPLEAALLICGAYDYGLKWPDYAWIFLDISLRNITSLVANCHPQTVEGIISLHTVVTDDDRHSKNGHHFETPSVIQHQNIYARALYDAILATTISLNLTFSQVQMFMARENTSLHSQFSKLRAQRAVSHMIGQTMDVVVFPGARKNRLSLNRAGLMDATNIAIFQTVGKTERVVGHYDQLSRSLSFDNLTSLVVPSDKLPREYKLLPLPVRATLTVCLGMCALLSLANVVLYLCYCKEPEVKASSVGLSMLVHLSCFLFLLGTANELREHLTLVVPPEKKCIVRIWTVYPASDLILSTILVKMCRIYHIFKDFAKIKKMYTDKMLLLVIALIVLVKLCLLACWTALDPYRIVETEIYHSETIPHHYEVVRVCQSHYYYLWAAGVLGYTSILAGLLVYVAFKARKIHRQNFKDTKKINIALSVILTSVAVILPMWWVFRREENVIGMKVLPALLFLIIAACCQVCFLCPKTFPPFRRSLRRLVNGLTHQHQRRRFTQEKIKFLKKPDPSELSLSITNSYALNFTADYRYTE